MKDQNIIALNLTSVSILFLVCTLRLFVRYHRKTWKSISKGWLLSDILVLLAVLLAISCSVLDSWIRFQKIDLKGQVKYGLSLELLRAQEDLKERGLQVSGLFSCALHEP